MNIKLFKHDQPKHLLFVLRDFAPDENFTNLTNVIQKDVLKIWDEIPKPRTLKDIEPHKVFECKFYKLSHFKFNNKQFLEECETMRNLFIGNRSNSLFEHFDYTSNLPVDGLSAYSQHIWSAIKENKDINLPSQKQMVANMRCDQIRQEALEEKGQQLGWVQRVASQQVIQSFYYQIIDIYNQVMQHYDNQASEYLQ